MRVRCLFFASLADRMGSGETILEVPEGETLSALVARLEGQSPGLAGYDRHYRVALDQEFVEDLEVTLSDGCEVALLPAVSGGQGDLVRLTESEISVDECLAAVRRPDCGAVVLFLGTVRDHAAGQPVERLDYTAYPAMARKEMDKLVDSTRRLYPVRAVACWHRYGSLQPGDISVAVAVSGPHRVEAFEAGRYLIDTLKSTVPLWKREIGPDGAVWIEGDARTPSA